MGYFLIQYSVRLVLRIAFQADRVTLDQRLLILEVGMCPCSANHMDKHPRCTLPKTITYDGRGSWAAFYQKFTLYTDEASMTVKQRRNNLCWCLQGKASEIFSTLTQRNPHMDYIELKLERRFGVRDLPETSQIEFQYAK